MDSNQRRDTIIQAETFRRNVFRLIPDGTRRVLDFGCGTGALALRLQRDKKCTEVYGLEVNPALTRELATLLDGGVFNLNIENQGETLDSRYRGYFNYIILHDVVEHFYDPWYSLPKLREFLAPGGKLLIATPNFHYWELQYKILSGDFPYGPGLWHTGHLRWYTVRSLIELVSLSGLAIESIFLEIPDLVDLGHLERHAEIRGVQLPPLEIAAKHPGLEPLVLRYPRDIKAYYPVFLAHKLIFVCNARPNVVVEPQPMVYNCMRLQRLREMVDNPFDVYTPPPMTPLIGDWC